MTRGFWKCKKCNYTRKIFIEDFISSCSECGAEYELLAYLVNFHVTHILPIFKLKTDDYSKAKTNGYSLLARGEGELIYECVDEGFYKFLEEKNLKNSKLIKGF